MKLSEHFDSEEWMCQCCGVIPAGFKMKFIGVLEGIRAWGCTKLGRDAPLKITNNGGYRCLICNEHAGGGSDSAHLNYNNMAAADIWIPGIDQEELAAHCLSLWAQGKLTGIGLPGPGNMCVHTDLEKIRPAKWRYK